MPTPLIFIDIYEDKPPLTVLSVLRGGRPQRWRWRALNGNNFRVLAVSSEAYTNYSDAVAAITELFGDGSEVYLRQAERGNRVLRLPKAA
jgi:hypothetical protein